MKCHVFYRACFPQEPQILGALAPVHSGRTQEPGEVATCLGHHQVQPCIFQMTLVTLLVSHSKITSASGPAKQQEFCEKP